MAITTPPLGASVIYRSRTWTDHAAIVCKNWGDGTFDLFVILQYADGQEYKRKITQVDSASPQPGSFTYDPTAVSNSLAPPGAPGILKSPPPGTTGATAIATQQDLIDALGIPTNLRVVQYNSSTSWTVPAGINWIRIEAVGGGGAGGSGGVSSGITNQAGGGGGASGVYTTIVVGVSAGDVLSIAVGAGGIAGGAAAGLTYVTRSAVVLTCAGKGNPGTNAANNSATSVSGGQPGNGVTNLAIIGAGGASGVSSGAEWGMAGSGGGGGGAATATNGGGGGQGGKRGTLSGYQGPGGTGASPDANGVAGSAGAANTGGGGGGGGGAYVGGAAGVGGNGGSGVVVITILG